MGIIYSLSTPLPKQPKNDIQALINLSSKVNAIALAYTLKLGLRVRYIKVETRKISSSTLEMFEIVLASFWVKDKLGQTCFFQKTFLLANVGVKVVLRMLFLTRSNLNIQFDKKKLTWRSYTTAKTFSTTKWAELINKKEFAKAVLDENSKTFVLHVAALEAPL